MGDTLRQVPDYLLVGRTPWSLVAYFQGYSPRTSLTAKGPPVGRFSPYRRRYLRVLCPVKIALPL